MILHCSCCLCTTITGVLIERVDTLNMRAVVTEKNNIIMVFADLVHSSNPLSLHKVRALGTIEMFNHAHVANLK